MNRGIYANASGMLASQRLLDLTASNLANAGTIGFKQDGFAFGESFEQAMYAAGGRGPQIGSLGSGPTAKTQFVDFRLGGYRPTGNNLDVALVEMNHMFKVQGENGTTFYTRNGSLALREGTLITKEGLPVLDANDQPIEVRDKGLIDIGQDGTLMVDGKVQGRIAIFEGSFTKSNLGAGRFESTDAQENDLARMEVGKLEESNVNTITAMIDMITLQRNFEMAQKSIQQQDDQVQRLIQSLSERS